MHWRFLLPILCLALAASTSLADETLYRFDGDVLPYDPSAGWRRGYPCDTTCSESIEDGHFVLRWTDIDEFIVTYRLAISNPGLPPPQRLFGSSGNTAPTTKSAAVSLPAMLMQRSITRA